MTLEAADYITRPEYERAYIGAFGKTVTVVRRRGATVSDAEDIAQGAWARAWERRRQLRDPTHVREFVYAIALNMFWDHVAQSRRLAPLFPAGFEPRVTPTVNLAAIDLDRIIDSPRQRELVNAVYMEGQSAAEVAASLGISVGAVHHRLSRLRAGLRRRLSAV